MTKPLRGRNGRTRKGKKGKNENLTLGGGKKAKKAIEGASDDMREMTVFAVWLVLIISWLMVMTAIQPQVTAQPLFNLIMTFGKQVNYFDTVWGVGILMMVAMVLDISWEIVRDRKQK